jgi:hypothetical protein
MNYYDENSSNASTPENSDIVLSIENNISIENIQEETSLINYTENHFNTKIQQELEKIRGINQFDNSYNSHYIRSNSPITISNHGSRSGSDSDSNNVDNTYFTDNDENILLHNRGYRKLSYRETEQLINKYYDLNIDNKFSTEIDILTTFIKAQKNLYIQSKHITQRKLNCLMFPTLFLSASITIIAPFVECMHWSTAFISGLNAIIMMCVSFINYLKLESSIENYLQNAKQYDKLETTLEMTNNKLLFIESDKEKNAMVLAKIKEIEKKISEIKEATNILVPEEIKLLFPIISNINIFSFIKKIEIYKKNLIIKFKDVKNEIRYILYKLGTNMIHDNVKEKSRLQFLYDVKNKLKDELLEFQSAYSHIDSIFTKEIKLAEIKKNEWTILFKSKHKSYTKGMNPMIDKYFQFIFVDE